MNINSLRLGRKIITVPRHLFQRQIQNESRGVVLLLVFLNPVLDRARNVVPMPLIVQPENVAMDGARFHLKNSSSSSL